MVKITEQLLAAVMLIKTIAKFLNTFPFYLNDDCRNKLNARMNGIQADTICVTCLLRAGKMTCIAYLYR